MALGRKYAKTVLLILASLWAFGDSAVARQQIVPGGGSQGRSAAGAIQRFFEALNGEDIDQMLVFYETGVTPEFRARKSWDEDRAMYERLRSDLGPLSVRGLRRTSPGEADATVYSEKRSKSVKFVFEIEDGRIAGFSVQPSGDLEAGGEFALPAGADNETMEKLVDEELSKRAEADSFSGVVLMARGSEPVFYKGYGLANREADIPITTGTRFDIGSITKMITKVAVAQLLAEGKLELDDTLFDIVPDYPDPEIARQITVQHLVEHRSGLGDIFTERWDAMPKEKLMTPKDFFPLFAGLPLQFEPGAGQAYSNAGYVVLGAVVEAAAGMDYTRYLEERVFEPAGMPDSGFPIRDGSRPEFAIGYTTGEMAGLEPGPLRPNIGMLPIRGCPAGSSSHTAEDLLKFDRALREHRLLRPDWTEWVFTGSLGDVQDTEPARLSVAFAGGGAGVSASLVSDGDTAVIVLANRDPQATRGLAEQLALGLRK